MPVKVDFSGLDKKFALIRSSAPAAREKALKDAMTGIMTQVIRQTPNDTNRMDAAFAQAANQAGLGPIPVPALRPSRRRAEYIDQLERQLNRWLRRVQLWESRIEWLQTHGLAVRKGRGQRRAGAGRETAKHKAAVREREKAQKYADKAQEQVDKFRRSESGIVVKNTGRKIELTVRDKVYGGEGSFAQVGGTAVVTIVNKEPHAIIIERRKRTVASLLRKSRGTGVLRCRGGYLKLMRERVGAATVTGR